MGASISAASRVRFSPAWVEWSIYDSETHDWNANRLRLRTWAGIYLCHYLSPETEKLEPFAEQTFADYVRMGSALVTCPMNANPIDT